MASGNYLAVDETRIRVLVQSIRDLYSGRSNATGAFTLVPNVSTTTVAAPNCGEGSVVLLSPLTANAAAAISTTYVTAVSRGSFVIAHANNAQADRTFGYVIKG